METPKKPVKKTADSNVPADKKIAALKPKSKFIDDDDDDEFDAPIDELGAYDNFDGLESDEDDF
jgi:hypothetical protein